MAFLNPLATKGLSINDVRFVWPFFDLPTNPHPILSYLSHTLMDIIYHIADFQKNILIVLTAFPLELKNK